MRHSLIVLVVCSATCCGFSAHSEWIGWGRWSKECLPRDLTNVISIRMAQMNASVITGQGAVINWDFMYDPLNGKWSDEQIYRFPKQQSFALTDILDTRIARYHGLVLTASGLAYSYPLHPNGSYFQVTPDGVTNIVSISTSLKRCAALRADGKLFSWGLHNQELPKEIASAVSIALGEQCLVAHMGDGTMRMWSTGPAQVPELFRKIVSLDIRRNIIVALTESREVLEWDYLSNDLARVCASNIVKITASDEGFAALYENGNILLWHHDSVSDKQIVKIKPNELYIRGITEEQTRVLLTSNVIDLADSGYGGVALIGSGEPVVNQQPISRVVRKGKDTYFTINVGGAWPMNIQWQHNGVNISGGISSVFAVRNVCEADGGMYKAIVSNQYGQMVSRGATLAVTER